MMIGYEPLPLGSVPGEPVSSRAAAYADVGAGAGIIIEGEMRTCKQSTTGWKRRGARMEVLLRIEHAETKNDRLHEKTDAACGASVQTACRSGVDGPDAPGVNPRGGKYLEGMAFRR